MEMLPIQVVREEERRILRHGRVSGGSGSGYGDGTEGSGEHGRCADGTGGGSTGVYKTGPDARNPGGSWSWRESSGGGGN